MFSFVGECDNVEKLRNEIMASAFILCDHLTFDHWQIIMFNENKMYGFILCSSYGDSLHGYGGLPSKIYFDRSEGDSPLCDLLDYKKQLFFHTPTVCDGDESECHTKSTEPSTTELYLPLITSIPHESEIIGCLHMSKCGTFQEDINELLDCDYSKPLVISIQRDFEIIHSGYLEGRKFLNLVHIFFNIASSKDPYLEGHSYNVALLSNLLGRKLNLSNHSLNRLYMASLLHDIGKVYIPEQILNKHDSLTDEEMDIVKKHSQYGYNILNDLFFPSENDLDLADIVLQHHERYDGSGYPNGLAGKDIRLESRIIAIADSIDAMLSVHSYKEPKSLQDTIDDIVFNKGKQFDPELIKPMIEVLIRRLELQESILERPIIAGTLEILTEIKSCQLQGTLIKTNFGYKFKPDYDECKCEKCSTEIPDLISSTFHTENNGKLYEYSGVVKYMDQNKMYITKLESKASYNYFSMPWSLQGSITLKNSNHFDITINKIGGDNLSFILKDSQFDNIDSLYDVNILTINFDDGTSVAITGKTTKTVRMSLNIYCEF